MTIFVPEILIGFVLGVVATVAFALILTHVQNRK